jgi:DNA-binding NarL/FixJ family response regulator
MVSAVSSRQRAIGELMMTGAKDAAIARQLGISLRTVRSEISALIAALGASSRFQAGCLLVRRFG